MTILVERKLHNNFCVTEHLRLTVKTYPFLILVSVRLIMVETLHDLQNNFGFKKNVVMQVEAISIAGHTSSED